MQYFLLLFSFFKKKYNDWKNKKEGISDNKNEPQWITDFELEMQTKFSLFWQYLEIGIYFKVWDNLQILLLFLSELKGISKVF